MTAKGDTNRKWTSTAQSRANHDRIFGVKPEPKLACPCDHCKLEWMRDTLNCICDERINWDLEQKQTTGE